MRIETAPIFQAFEGVLSVLDPEERARVERILAASHDSVQRALLDVLRQAADEVNTASTEVHAHLRHGMDGAEFVVTEATEARPSVEVQFDSDEIERLTLRLPSDLKELAAIAARQHGVSLNTWLTRLVGRAAQTTSEKHGWSWPADRPGAGPRSGR